MSAPRHTRDPWLLLPEEPGVPYIRIRGSRPGELYKVANVILPSAMDSQGIEEARQNARLIAAAPKLLAALQDALLLLSPHLPALALAPYRIAIAQATGDAP